MARGNIFVTNFPSPDVELKFNYEHIVECTIIKTLGHQTQGLLLVHNHPCLRRLSTVLRVLQKWDDTKFSERFGGLIFDGLIHAALQYSNWRTICVPSVEHGDKVHPGFSHVDETNPIDVTPDPDESLNCVPNL